MPSRSFKRKNNADLCEFRNKVGDRIRLSWNAEKGVLVLKPYRKQSEIDIPPVDLWLLAQRQMTFGVPDHDHKPTIPVAGHKG